jgi:hypothetical protein
MLTGAADHTATRELSSDHRSPKKCRVHRGLSRPPERSFAHRGNPPRNRKRKTTMSKNATKKAIRKHRQLYETAGQMIRDGLWTQEYAAFHFSTVTRSLSK